MFLWASVFICLCLVWNYGIMKATRMEDRGILRWIVFKMSTFRYTHPYLPRSCWVSVMERGRGFFQEQVVLWPVLNTWDGLKGGGYGWGTLLGPKSRGCPVLPLGPTTALYIGLTNEQCFQVGSWPTLSPSSMRKMAVGQSKTLPKALPIHPTCQDRSMLHCTVPSPTATPIQWGGEEEKRNLWLDNGMGPIRDHHHHHQIVLFETAGLNGSWMDPGRQIIAMPP